MTIELELSKQEAQLLVDVLSAYVGEEDMALFNICKSLKAQIRHHNRYVESPIFGVDQEVKR